MLLGFKLDKVFRGLPRNFWAKGQLVPCKK